MLILCLFTSKFWQHYNTLGTSVIFSLHICRNGNGYLCTFCQNSDTASDPDLL